MPYNPSFRDRYIVEKKDLEEATSYADSVMAHFGFTAFRPRGVIGIYSSERGEAHLNFYFRRLESGVEYLGRIQFYLDDPKLNFNSVDWQASESSGDPPATLEELIERGLPGASIAQFLARAKAKEYVNFFEIYLGIYDRLFPHTEHHEIYTDVGPYAEASTSHLKKELWRTDLLTRLQGLRFPKLEIENIKHTNEEGARVVWEPQGHTNYMIWFNLFIGGDPKVCVYVDPTHSGSTTGWLSTRLIKNENALEKLPYTLEQWAVEDLKGKRYGRETSGPKFANYRQRIRELLAHHIPHEAEEAWAAIRRQLVGVRHHELYTAPEGYAESLTEQHYKPKHGVGARVYSQYGARFGGKGTIVDITKPGPGTYDDPEYVIRWDGAPDLLDNARSSIVDKFWTVEDQPVRHHELYTSDEAGYAEAYMKSPRVDLSGLTEDEIRDALPSWRRLGPDYSYDALDLPDVTFTWKCPEGYILFGLEEDGQIFSVSFADPDFKGTVGVDFNTNKLPGNGRFLLRAVKAKNVDPAEFEPYLIQLYEQFIRLFRIPEHHELYTSGYEE